MLVALLCASLYLAPGSLAGGTGKLGSGNLGNGPSAPPKAPKAGSLSVTAPLISMLFKNGKITSVSGTAVRRRDQIGRLGASNFKHVKCGVNFTHSRLAAASQTSVAWFGGIGCGRPMVLFGQAYLQQSARTVSGVGNHYQSYESSAASGSGRTVVPARNPSLYIRHLVNANFLNPGGSGWISIYPAPGQRVNAASQCVATSTKGYGFGVHCALYSNRF